MKQETKFCNRCKIEKSVKEFGRRGGFEKHVFYAFCNSCRVKIVMEWRKNNRERYNQYQRQYQNNHKKNGKKSI